MTQAVKFTHLVYLLPFWKANKYCQMHISSDSLSAAAAHSGWQSSIPRGSERQDAHTHRQVIQVSPSSQSFSRYLLWHKSAFVNMLQSNIFPYTWYTWPTTAVCIHHTHTYILSLLLTTVGRAFREFSEPPAAETQNSCCYITKPVS